MSNFTRRSVQKLEAIFEQLDYKVRYERGSFQSGYCIVEDRKIVVINKFFDLDGRGQTMLDILSTLYTPESKLDDALKGFLEKQLLQHDLAPTS